MQLLKPLNKEEMDMKKRFGIFLMTVSMVVFGSMAFAGDDWQDGFAKALDENNLSGAMILAYNSQASPRAVHEALEAFGVGQEEVGQGMLILAESDWCLVWCTCYQNNCCPVSPSEPDYAICQYILTVCDCTCK